MNEAALRERIEFLEADNANLRARLRLVVDDDFISMAKVGLGLRPTCARLLWALWDSRPKTKEALFDALYGDQADPPDIKIIDAFICHLRAATGAVGAGVQTHWGFGYQLLPADRAKIAAHIGIEVQP